MAWGRPSPEGDLCPAEVLHPILTAPQTLQMQTGPQYLVGAPEATTQLLPSACSALHPLGLLCPLISPSTPSFLRSRLFSGSTGPEVQQEPQPVTQARGLGVCSSPG